MCFSIVKLVSTPICPNPSFSWVSIQIELISFISEIIFNCLERFRLSRTQWNLLCRLTYGIYCTGGSFSDRPVPVVRDSTLELTFQTAVEFHTFYQRALGWTPSHLVEFEVSSIEPNRVVGEISANHTPEMTLIHPQEISPDIDPNALIIRIDHMD